MGAASIAMAAALLPVLPALLAGECFYFRDLSRYYFPLRHYLAEGLRQGELRYWNPLVFEGIPEVFPPLSYPLDVLQMGWGTERMFTLLLSLHLPLAALGFFFLARVLGVPPAAAGGGAVAYASGGFALSTLSLYDTPALAWAPFVAAALVRATELGGRAVVVGAGTTAVLLSTGRVEMAAQTLALAAVLARLGRSGRRWGRFLASATPGALLAAPTFMVMRSALAESRRGLGLDVATVTGRSLHPLGLVQTAIANLHGDLANLAGRYWGDNFFEPGVFPYYLSLYLGPTVLGLALLGAIGGRVLPRGLLFLTVGALWLGLGKWAGLDLLVEAVPPWARWFRFPSKVFFTVHFSACLLAASALAGLLGADPRRWRRAAALLALLGGLLVAILILPRWPAEDLAALVAFLFPDRYASEARHELLALVAADAARGGAIALTAAGVALAASRGRLTPQVGVILVSTLAALDLVRAGVGLNPSVTPAFFALSAEVEPEIAHLREVGGRVFTCGVPTSAAWRAARPVQSDDVDVWTFAAMRDTATPYFNVRARLPTAFGEDLTALVPVQRTTSALGFGDCASVPRILEELRSAGVAHVVSLDPLDSPGLVLRAEVRPRAIAPLAVRVYGLRNALPLRFVAREVVVAQPGAGRRADSAAGATVVETGTPATGVRGQVLESEETTQRLLLRVEADRPTVVVVRDAWAPGWRASVNGREAPVLRADGRHRAVPIPGGTSEVLLEYRPPGLRAGLVVAGLTALAMTGLWISRARPSEPASTAPAGNVR